ncbi:MAG: hypothetical protein OEY51_14605 [Cyclobacteriaceae bacterium]|nr:hypothetical protein [Cyclobacteriaceae bacterium]
MRFSVIIFLIVFAFGCGGKKPSEEAFLQSLDSTANAAPEEDEEMINAILQQIPSPIEISVMLKESGSKYDAAMLNSTNNLSKYNTNFQKAMNLGIYGTDLGYTNIFEQNQDGLNYMSSIKELADGLSIGQFFDLETIGRLASNSANLDSLLTITTQNFNNINEYLQTQGRSHLSVMLLIGGWLEAMHITCTVAERSPDNKDLMDAIGNQQVVTESLKLLLELYAENPILADLGKDMAPLWEEFAKIEITVEKGETTTEVIDGIMIVRDNSVSTVHISQENIKRITNIITTVRNKVIG